MTRARLGRGGPKARLSFFLLLASAATAPSAPAEGDPLEDILDLDYARQLIPLPDAPRPPVGALPGYPSRFPAADSAPPGRLSASLGLGVRSLIHGKTGDFAFDAGRRRAGLDLASAAIPGMVLRFAAERDDRDLSFRGDSSALDAGGGDWGWRAAAGFALTPWVIPSIVVGGRSSASGAGDLEALSLRGSSPAGLSWSVAWGRRRRDFPARLALPGYDPLPLPFLFRQDFREAGLALARGPWELSWHGRWTASRPPRTRPEGYSLDDSASGWRQEARLAYARAGFLAALDFDLGLGAHLFRGRSRKGETLSPFSWQEGERADYALRADLAFPHRRGAWGGWLAAGESEYDALRPEVAFRHYLWDRNAVIESYQGSLAGLFSNENWLLNGMAYAAHSGGGLWGHWKGSGFGIRIFQGFQYLALEAESHFTRRRTLLLLGYTETRRDRLYPLVEAWLAPAGADATLDWGRSFTLSAGVQAALPVRVKQAGREPGADAGEGGHGGGKYRGGMTAGASLGYRLP